MTLLWDHELISSFVSFREERVKIRIGSYFLFYATHININAAGCLAKPNRSMHEPERLCIHPAEEEPSRNIPEPHELLTGVSLLNQAH